MKKLSDKGSFEKHWEEAFRNAEKKPPDAVWDKVNAELTGMEISGYQKRLVLFKWLAAASILLALGFGFYSLYLRNGISESTVNKVTGVERSPGTAATRPEVPAGPDGGQIAAKTPAGMEMSNAVSMDNSGKRNPAHRKPSGLSDSGPGDGGTGQMPATPVLSQIAMEKTEANGSELNNPDGLPTGTPAGSGAYFAQANSLSLTYPEEKPALPVDYMYRRPVVPVNFKSKNRREQPVRLYAGLNFSTGRFNPNYQNADNATALSSADLAVYYRSSARVSAAMSMSESMDVAQESYQPDVSYAYGLNMGARIARKWVLRGGLSYLKANSIANTTAYIQDHANDERYPVLKAANYEGDGVVEIRQTENKSYKNAFEFASVPLKAGYILLDKKVDLVIFGGVSSEFFLKNTITAEDNLTNVVTQSPGSDSPYRSVYFNGLLSTALGYTIAGHYRLSLEPGYRMALNTFTRDSFILTGKPDAFYVNFGVSYRFK